MSEQLYSIKESTLTGIGDALRRRHGETEIVTVEGIVPDIFVSKTNKATSFTNLGGTTETNYSNDDVVTIPNANSIQVQIAYQTAGFDHYVKIYSDSFSTDNLYTGSSSFPIVNASFTFENTDTITFHYEQGYNFTTATCGYYAECIGYDVEGNAIGTIGQVDKEIPRVFTSDEMAEAIDDILPSPPEEAYMITGDCMYRFANGGWDWFINEHGDMITTQNLDNCANMFNGSKAQCIPFDINLADYKTYVSTEYLFYGCTNLLEIPKIKNGKIGATNSIFGNCQKLRYLPEDIAEHVNWQYHTGQTSPYSAARNTMFRDCYSLRKIPMDFLKYCNPNSTYGYAYFYSAFNGCYALDELVDLPIPYTATWTSNAFSSTFHDCRRVKNITFAMQDDEKPYIMNWKSQVIDLSSNVGHASYSQECFLIYNSGLTADTYVTHDEAYQELKDNPDMFCVHDKWSRYNHDSAVATINSLPDTSAYLASAGGTNTIKFKGAAGSATDGGAINTMTEEEIAVAAAKGWTVTFA